jgi:hypothetical protein
MNDARDDGAEVVLPPPAVSLNAGTATLRTAMSNRIPVIFRCRARRRGEAEFNDAKPSGRAAGTARSRFRPRQPGGETGELFATFHTPAVFLNQVTSPHRDRHTLTPEYKVTAVRIDKL